MASILIMNTSFRNKGDALMTEAILRRFAGRHDVSMMASLAVRNPVETRDFRIYMDSDRPAGPSLKQRAFNWAIGIIRPVMEAIPDQVWSRRRYTLPRNVDAAFDVSGYCFGDPWGRGRIDLATMNYRRLKRGGSKVILMPKTWGPFDEIDPNIVNAMFKYIDLAFARDQTSLSRMRSVLSPMNAKKLEFAPDYTHEVTVKPAGITGAGIAENVAYIIPSSRVIDSGTLSRDQCYQVISLARRELNELSLRAKLLIHETSNDIQFVTDANKMGFLPDEIVIAESALHAKSLIAGAAIVVTSRLHGLYNALNSAIPVIALAWSFKYLEALEQYGCEDCIIKLDNPFQSMKYLLGKMTRDSAFRDDLVKKMRAGKSRSTEHTNKMWSRIDGVTGISTFL